jgi:hypothetical protein
VTQAEIARIARTAHDAVRAYDMKRDGLREADALAPKPYDALATSEKANVLNVVALILANKSWTSSDYRRYVYGRDSVVPLVEQCREAIFHAVVRGMSTK